MSRNGCDHMNSNAESRISARVRSDLATLARGCGRTRGGEDSFVKCDIVSYYSDNMSYCHLALCRISVWLFRGAGTVIAPASSSQRHHHPNGTVILAQAGTFSALAPSFQRHRHPKGTVIPEMRSIVRDLRALQGSQNTDYFKSTLNGLRSPPARG